MTLVSTPDLWGADWRIYGCEFWDCIPGATMSLDEREEASKSGYLNSLKLMPGKSG